MTNQSDLRVTPFSTHWGTYFAEVRDGRLTGVRDYANDPDPAVIRPGIVDMVDHPTRIGRPAVSRGCVSRAPGRMPVIPPRRRCGPLTNVQATSRTGSA